MNKGSYLLILYLAEDCKIRVGRLGEMKFKRGYYLYVGSALNSLTSRLKWHLESKKKHWHIDYFKEKAKIIGIVALVSNKRLESEIANSLKGEPVRGFGSTDTKDISHLFYYNNVNDLVNDLATVLKHHIINVILPWS